MIKKIIIYCIITSFALSGFGQKAIQYGLSSPSALLTAPKQDKQRLLDEDEKQPKGRLRCAVLLPYNVSFPGDIIPETIAEGTIWRMKIDAEDAEAINLYLEDFQLPKGAELSFYTSDYQYKLPTVFHDENPENGIFVTDHLPTGRIIVELFAPKKVAVNHCFTIKEIGYMYRPLPQWLKSSRAFGDSKYCEVNINCPEGDNWQDEKKGIARILLVAGGSLYYCSGSLINNARFDKTPYFLTAYHCAESTTEEEFKKWKFYFNYESPSCINPNKDPINEAFMTTGAEKIAAGILGNWEGSDFLLLKLDDKVTNVPDLVYNGWNISPTPPSRGVGIHHPQGDIKKISTFTKTLQEIAEIKTHWSLQWDKTQTNHGVTEPGSSGSPIFDQNKFIVGTLSAGDADCATPAGHDFYGKMTYHWNKNGTSPITQLKPWLDPDNKGITELTGTGGPSYTWWHSNQDTTLAIRLGRDDKPEIKVYDIYGRLLMQMKTTKDDIDETNLLYIDISSLSGGLYIIVLNGNNGRKTQKIIKR